MEIRVYACPTPGCGNYFGTSSMPELDSEIVGQHDANFSPRPESEWFPRSQCPDCRQRGDRVSRVLIAVSVTVPVPADVA